MAVGKLSFGALGRLLAAGAAAYAGASMPPATIESAFATVAVGYFINRATSLEDRTEQGVSSPTQHLRLALAGSIRLALANLQSQHAEFLSFFNSWHSILDAALDAPDTVLAAIIPDDFDSLLDMANPLSDEAAAASEAETNLRYWLAYQQAFQSTGRYPAVPPSSLPMLPPELHHVIRSEFLSEFQKAFALLLDSNNSEFARRAFHRLSLQELVATSRRHTEILERIESRQRLPLSSVQPFKATEVSDLDFLRAENAVTPLVGRLPELLSLKEWALSSIPVSVRVLTGPAGSGKTRLGIQVMTELAQVGWEVGFLRDRDLGELMKHRWFSPTFAVVEDAALVAESIKPWLAYLADQKSEYPIRVLLIERDSNPESGWLRFILDRTDTGYRIASIFDPFGPQHLIPLSDLTIRRQILQDALERLGSEYVVPIVGQDSLFDQRLGETHCQNPLYLLMAALVARRQGSPVDALSLGRSDLVFLIADRELDRIRRFALVGFPRECADVLAHVACLVTACGSLERAELLEISREEAQYLGIDFPGGPRTIAQRVAEAMSSDASLNPGWPDVIGEAMMLRVFGGENLKEGTLALIRAARRANYKYSANICSAVLRTCQDFAIEDSHDSLLWVDEMIDAAVQNDLTVLRDLEAQMPDITLVLRERGARLEHLLLEKLRPLDSCESTDEILFETASLSAHIAQREASLCRYQEAVRYAEEGNRILEELANRRSEFTPAYAFSLLNFAARRFQAGDARLGMAIAMDASVLFQKLSNLNEDIFLPELARSMMAVAHGMSLCGLREDAVRSAEQAINISRTLVERKQELAAYLAAANMEFAALLAEVGRYDEALERAGEAVRLFRALADRRPDAYSQSLAEAHLMLANALSDVGRNNEALDSASEAVRMFEHLNRSYPNGFLPLLAKSLNNLANRCSDVHREVDALQYAERAVKINGELAKQNPDAFLPEYARSLHNLANRLRIAQRLDEALGHAEEALRIYRDLDGHSAGAFAANIAMSLCNIAPIMDGVGRYEDALVHAEEAVRMYRSLAQESPDAFRSMLARSLAVASNELRVLARWESALKYSEEGVEIYRKLVEQNAQAFLPDLAGGMACLGHDLARNGRLQEGVTLVEEAAKLLRGLGCDNPIAFSPKLGPVLINLTSMLGELGQHELASDRAEEAAELYRGLRRTSPDGFLSEFVASLSNAATALDRLGKSDSALARLEEVIRILRGAVDQGSHESVLELAEVLSAAGKIALSPCPDRAVAFFREAIVVLTSSELSPLCGPVLGAVCRWYLRACQIASVSPDCAILLPVFDSLEQLWAALGEVV